MEFGGTRQKSLELCVGRGSSVDLDGAHLSTNELIGAWRRSSKLGGGQRSSAELNGAWQSSEKLDGALWNSVELGRARRSSAKFDKARQSWLELCGARRRSPPRIVIWMNFILCLHNSSYSIPFIELVGNERTNERITKAMYWSKWPGKNQFQYQLDELWIPLGVFLPTGNRNRKKGNWKRGRKCNDVFGSYSSLVDKIFQKIQNLYWMSFIRF